MKPERNRTRIIRLYKLEEMILNSEKGFTVQQICKHFRINRRTVYRDIELIEELGIPVYKDGSFYKILGGYKTPSYRLKIVADNTSHQPPTGLVGEKETMNASVKVMNSFDYCHFEVVLSAENLTLEEIDNLRKEAQRLVDKAIKQYKIAKRVAALDRSGELERKANTIRKIYPESEWTPEQKAIVKQHDNESFRASLIYDYQDDWEEDEERW